MAKDIKEGFDIVEFGTFTDMLKKLPDDESCRVYLESKIWTNGLPTCPHCGSTEHYKLNIKGEFKGLYKCANCKKRYTVLKGTMFEGSHIPLRQWFIAIYIFSMHKKGISSHQLASDLGITQKTAWFMLSRIRVAFSPEPSDEPTDGMFQIDETYVGGKSKNKHKSKRKEGTQGRSVKDKTPILGIYKVGGGIKTFVVPNTQANTVKPVILKMVKEGALIVTDEWKAYDKLSKNYDHVVIKHSNEEYVRGAYHNNTIEGFWSQLKRGIYGIYHQVSPKHLDKYAHEFAYRYNSRKASINDKFNYSLQHSKRITYAKLTRTDEVKIA